MRPTARSGALLLVAAASMGVACARGVEAAKTEEAAPSVPMSANPMNVDLEMLRIDLPGERVLVKARGKPFIRAHDYNAWLGTYPLNITKADAPGAQAQALDQMVTFRVLLERAVAAGYDSKYGASADAPSIVLRYVTDQIRNATGISDSQARTYHDAHREELHALDAPEVPPEIRLAAWKSAARGAQLASSLESQRKDAGVEILYPTSSSAERN